MAITAMDRSANCTMRRSVATDGTPLTGLLYTKPPTYFHSLNRTSFFLPNS